MKNLPDKSAITGGRPGCVCRLDSGNGVAVQREGHGSLPWPRMEGVVGVHHIHGSFLLQIGTGANHE